MKRASGDAALSDVIGTILMLGTTVAVIGLVAVNLMSAVDGSDPPARLDVSASARPGDAVLTLVHAGGDAFDAGDLRVVVASGAATLADAPLGSPGATWRLGETISVGLASPLIAGQDLDVALVSLPHGVTVARASAHLPPAPAAIPSSGGFSVTVLLNGTSSSETLTTPAPLPVRAAVAHGGGRLAIGSVVADLRSVGAGSLELRDDGVGSDVLAGDAIYSGQTLVPANVAAGDHPIVVTAVDLQGATAAGAGTLTTMPGTTGASGTNQTIVTTGTTYVTGPASGSFTGNTTIYGNVTQYYLNATNGTSTNGTNGFHGNFTGNFSGNFSGELTETMVYNSSLIRAFAHRIIKFESGPSDAVTTEVKLKLVQDPIVMADGLTYSFRSVHVNYDWLKPGAVPWIPLDDGGSGASPWFCQDAATDVFALRAGNATINSFEKEWDPLYYYFILEWQQVGGAAVHTETVSTSATDQYFTLRRTTDHKEVRDDDDWTTNYTDCSDQ